MAATNTTNILIFGATGLIGEHITRAIVESRTKFGRIAIFTSSNTLWTKSDEIDELKSHGVEILSGDITSASDVNEAYSGFDTVVSCVGRSVIHTQVKLIELADRHPDVSRFLPSEYGTDIEYGPASAHEKPHQQKLKVRAALEKAKNLQYTYVVTGPYGNAESLLYLAANKPENEAAGSYDVHRKRAVVSGDGNGRISLTTMQDVGRLVVAALLHPEEARDRALHVNSFTATPNQIVAEFERQTGGTGWTVAHTPLDRLRELEQEAYAKGSPRAGALTLRRIWAEGGTLYDQRDNHLIGMDDDVADLAKAVSQAIEVQTSG